MTGFFCPGKIDKIIGAKSLTKNKIDDKKNRPSVKKRSKTEKDLAKQQRSCRPVKTSAHKTANDETLQEELVRVNPDWAALIDIMMKCPSCGHGLLVPVTPLAEIEAETRKLRAKYERKKANGEDPPLPDYPKV